MKCENSKVEKVLRVRGERSNPIEVKENKINLQKVSKVIITNKNAGRYERGTVSVYRLFVNKRHHNSLVTV